MKQKYINIVVFVLIIIAILVGNHHFGWSAYLSDADHLLFIDRKSKRESNDGVYAIRCTNNCGS